MVLVETARIDIFRLLIRLLCKQVMIIILPFFNHIKKKSVVIVVLGLVEKCKSPAIIAGTDFIMIKICAAESWFPVISMWIHEDNVCCQDLCIITLICIGCFCTAP